MLNKDMFMYAQNSSPRLSQAGLSIFVLGVRVLPSTASSQPRTKAISGLAEPLCPIAFRIVKDMPGCIGMLDLRCSCSPVVHHHGVAGPAQSYGDSSGIAQDPFCLPLICVPSEHHQNYVLCLPALGLISR